MNEKVILHMALLNEGVEVWRPVEATSLGLGAYRIDSLCDTEDEEWEFPSGAIVLAHPKKLSDGFRLVPSSLQTDSRATQT